MLRRQFPPKRFLIDACAWIVAAVPIMVMAARGAQWQLVTAWLALTALFLLLFSGSRLDLGEEAGKVRLLILRVVTIAWLVTCVELAVWVILGPRSLGNLLQGLSHFFVWGYVMERVRDFDKSKPASSRIRGYSNGSEFASSRSTE